VKDCLTEAASTGGKVNKTISARDRPSPPCWSAWRRPHAPSAMYCRSLRGADSYRLPHHDCAEYAWHDAVCEANSSYVSARGTRRAHRLNSPGIAATFLSLKQVRAAGNTRLRLYLTTYTRQDCSDRRHKVCGRVEEVHLRAEWKNISAAGAGCVSDALRGQHRRRRQDCAVLRSLGTGNRRSPPIRIAH